MIHRRKNTTGYNRNRPAEALKASLAFACELFNDAKYKFTRFIGQAYRASWRFIHNYDPKTFLRHTAFSTLASLFLFAGIGLFSSGLDGLRAASTNLSPNGDITTDWPTTTGADHYTEIDEDPTPDTADYIATDTSNNDFVDEFAMETASSILEATSVTVYVYANAVTIQSDPDTLNIDMRINGTLQGAQTVTPSSGSYTWLSATFTGTWTQADIDSMQVQLTRTVVGSGSPSGRADEIRVATVYADMTYEPNTTLEQSSYRWFENEGETNQSSGSAYQVGDTGPAGGIIFFVDETNTYPDFDYLESTQSDYGGAAEWGCDGVSIGSTGAAIGAGEQNTADIVAHTCSSSDGITSAAEAAANHSQNGYDDWFLPSSGELNLMYDNQAVIGGFGSSIYWSSTEAGSSEAKGLDFGIQNPSSQSFPKTSGYRARFIRSIFDSVSEAAVGAPLAAQDTATTAPAEGTPFRLRTTAHVSSAELPANAADLKLQYAQQGSDAVCDPSFTGEGYDVVMPQAPMLTHTGTISPVDSLFAQDVYVSGNYAYVASRDSDSLTVIDISDPANPTETGFISNADLNSASGVHVSNNYAYVATGAALTIIDVSDPTNPTQTGTVSSANLDDAHDVYVSGDYAYVTSRGSNYDGLTIIDISDPASPVQSGTVSTSDLIGAQGVYVSGNYAYVASGFDLDAADSLTAIDISDSANPVQTGTVSNTDLNGAHSVYVSDNYAYVASENADSLTVIDIFDPANLIQTSTISTSSISGAQDVHVEGSYAYVVSSNSSLTAIDISDPTNPIQAGTISIQALESAHSVYVSGSYAYVASRTANTLTVFDVSIPDISFFDNTNLTDGMALSNSVDDPVHGTDTNVYQSYVESNNFINPNAIPDGQDGLWDFSLVDNNAPADTNYCFRMVNSDNSELATYSSIAEITTSSPIMTQDDYRWFENQDAINVATWVQTIGGTGADEAEALVQTSDGGYAVAGRTDSYGAGSSDQTLVKYDANGNEQWSKTWGGTGNDYAHDLAETTDGGYAVAGYTTGYGAGSSDQTLVKYDSAGVEQWSKTWGGTSNDFAYALVQTSDGGYAVAGYTDSYGAGSYDQTLVKYDVNGIEQWSKTWGGTGWDTAYDLVQTTDGGYAVAGYTDSYGAGSYDQTLVKYDSAGVEQWSKTWGGISDELAQALVQTADGGYAVAGETNSYGAGSYDQTLVKYDANGVEQWSKTWGGTGWDNVYALVQASDGGYAVAGRTDSYGAGSYDQTLVKYDSSGVEQWSKTWGGTGNDYAHDLVETTDGGYAVAGYTTSYGAGGDDQTFIKQDVNGDIANCDSCVSQTVTEADHTVTEADQTVTEADQTVTEADQTVTEADQTANSQITVVCGAVTFANALGGTSTDFAEALVQTTDGGYAVAGYTGSYGAGSYDQSLVKYDSAGVEQWSKTWGGTGVDIAYDLVETSDGGYAMAGYTASYGAGANDQTLVKYDSAGVEQWSKTWGGTSTDNAYALVQTADGGYAVAGYTDSYGAGLNDQTLVKYDSAGVEQWSKTWGGTSNDFAYALLQTTDGGYAVAGETNSYGAGGNDQTLVKYDSAGVEQWSKTWGGTGWDTAYDLVQTTDGGYAVAGRTDSYGAGGNDQTLVKYDSAGVEQWSKTWGGTGNDYAHDLVETTDGGYAVAGRTDSYGAGSYDQTLVKYDSAGVEQWSKTWGDTGDDRARALLQTTDGGYAVAGYTDSYGAGTDDQILVKYDNEGNVANCGSICGEVTISEADQTVVEDDVIITEANQNVSEADQTVTEADQTASTIETEIIELALIPIYKLFVGAAQAALSTLYDTQSYDELVRLRLLVQSTNKPATSGTFKLQYAPRFGQCDTGFAGESYVDVPGSFMTYFDNTIADDGLSIEPSSDDPANGSTTRLQSYVESNNFSLSSTVGRSENALWDFALKETGISGGSYCFRIVYADGSLLDNYTHIPELGVPAHTPQQLRHGRWFDSAEQSRPFYW